MKILKILAATLALWVLAAIAVLLMLPSPADIGKQLPKPKPVMSAPLPHPSPSALSSASLSVASETSPIPVVNHTEEQARVVADLMDDSHPVSDVCDYLSFAGDSQPQGYKIQEFNERLVSSTTDARKDPLIQLFKPVLRTVLRLPTVSALVTMAQAAAEKGDYSLLKKAEFYAQVLSAYQELSANRGKVESLLDRQYLLLNLIKATIKSPGLIGDSAVTDYCRKIEGAINSGQVFKVDEEKAALLDFLKDAGVDPADIGYDPAYHTKLKISQTSAGLTFQGGWMDRLVVSH